MSKINIKIKLLTPSAKIPNYATEFSAGADLCSASEEIITIPPHEIRMIPTGIAIEPEDGANIAVMIYPRSGLASKFGVTLANGVGVIDSDYRGEIKIPLINHGAEPYEIHSGERVAQAVFTPILRANFIETDELSSTERGVGGFGSTGKI